MFVPEGDTFRAFHPDYERAHREDPILMPDITSQASGQWLRRSIDLGFRERSSMLIEGTWRDEKVPTSALARAIDGGGGYRVHAVVLAVPPEVSRLDTLGRYYDLLAEGEPARWTPPIAHDEAVARLSATVMTLAGHPDIATFSVVTRDGTYVLDQEPPSTERAARSLRSLEEARDGYWTPAARSAWLDAAADREELHVRYTREDAQAAAVWQQINDYDRPSVEVRG